MGEVADAIDRMLKGQNARGDMIETLWQLYASHVGIPIGGTQWTESRRCFFAGAATLFEAVMRVLDEDREPTEADLAHMDAIAKELERFHVDVAQGRA